MGGAVRHPGPRSRELHFPFEEARDAAMQARALADDLRSLHGRIASETDALAASPFEGRFADWFVGLRDASVDALVHLVDRLEAQADLVDALGATADLRIAERNDDIERWARREAAWRSTTTEDAA